MSSVVRAFRSCREASEFARHLSKSRSVALGVVRTVDGWAVTSESAMTVTAEDLEGRLLDKDLEADELRRHIASMQEQLLAAVDEKERFRKRVIQNEAKAPEQVAAEFANSHVSVHSTEPKCEACFKPLSFCICSG